MKTTITLPEFLPDQTSTSGGLNIALNVLPRIDGYGPVPQFSGISPVLPEAFNGGAAFLDSSGGTAVLVGTQGGLSRYSGGAWNALMTGLSGAGPWRFAQFGDNVVAVTAAGTKVINLTAGTATALTGAPSGSSIAIVGDYVVIGQNSGDKLGVYTSGFNDHTDWDYTSSTSSATYQPMLDGGEVMGLAGGEYGVILQRQAIRRMTRTGDATAPFQYDVICNNIGCAAKSSVIAVGRTVYWLSERGFMALTDGQGTPSPIGSQKVDATFQNALARADYERMWACADPQKKLVMWCIPGVPGKIWAYHYELGRWSTISLPIEGIFPAFSPSVTLEDLDGLYGTLEAVPVTLDDARFVGGSPMLYAFQGGIMGTLSGDNLAARISTSFYSPAAPSVTRTSKFRPITDAASGMTITLDCRARLGDSESRTISSELRPSGVVPMRASGRYCMVRLDLSQGADWSFVQGFEWNYEAGGER